MKKFLLSLLSIFIIIGGGLLAACGRSVTTLTLSQDSVSIEILSNDPDGGYKTITAQVSGASDTSVRASTVSGYENIIQVSSQAITGGKTQITVRGLTEGYAEFMVRTNQGNAYKVVSVDVYSTVSEMKQKTEEAGKIKNYLIRGIDNTLKEESLITFTPSEKSRRQITWSLVNEVAGLTLKNDVLNIAQDFEGEEVVLKATTEKGVETQITLPVITAISKSIDLYWGYDKNSDFSNEKTSQQNPLNIVPNIVNDASYEAYVYVDYIGELDVSAYAVDANGNATDDLEITRDGENSEHKPLFKIAANKNKTNLNGEYKIYFKIGYSDYAYEVTSQPVFVSVREKVNKIVVSNKNTYDLSGKNQVLYSNYSSSSDYGEKLTVSVLPTTVIGKSNKYTIKVEYTGLTVGNIFPDGYNGSPVEVTWKNTSGDFLPIEFTKDEDAFVSGEISYENIYLKAPSVLLQNYDQIKVTVESVDNKDVKTEFNVSLVRSATEENFDFSNAGFKVDSSQRVEEVVLEKELTLLGQSTLDGIYLINNSQHVNLSINQKSSTDNSVTFSVVLTLNRDSFGITQLDKYQIAHRNGYVSDEYDIDIFLPLKDAGIVYDSTSESNSVTYATYSNNMYAADGSVLTSNIMSIDKIILKDDTVTPVLYQYNTSNSKSAVADISIKYLDYNPEEDFEEFKNKSPLSLVALFEESVGDNSGIISFANDKSSIITKGVGYTYAVLKFTGKGVEGDNEFYRIILVESYVSPEGLEVSPQKDKQILIYSSDSVSSNDSDVSKQITILFDNKTTTHHEFANVEFESTLKNEQGNPVMGNMTVGENSITWEQGRYSISNVVVKEDSITFNINALSIFGDSSFVDQLNVHYVLRDGTQKIYDIYTRVDITIKNAQRVEKLVWVNQNDDGINFRLNDTQPYYMILSTTPSQAKNLTTRSIVTSESGDRLNTFVNVNNGTQVGDVKTVNISSTLKTGMSGYIYLLPEDAIYNSQIKYKYKTEENGETVEKDGAVSVDDLGKTYNGSQSWYEYLVSNAYFISNTETNEAKLVNFSDILVRIKVNVADGKSFDYAYKVYSLDDFKTKVDPLTLENTFDPDAYYTVMTNLDLTDFDQVDEFNGGLQGKNSDVTLTLSKPFANTNKGKIQNITFIGDVVGQGFVANTNSGTIHNVTVDVNGIMPSTLTYSGSETYVGGIAGVNKGTIQNANVLGLSINAPGKTVGGFAGQNDGTVKDSLVEFYNLKLGDDDTYGTNTFVGGTVKAFVGTGNDAENCNAYKYVDEDVDVGVTENVETKTPETLSDPTIATFKNNEYYKSIAVDSTKGIMFYYDVNTNGNDLTNSEKKDLDALNTISLKDLIGQDVAQNIVVTSSNINVINVVGNLLQVKATGDVQLTISSKQNVEDNKTIEVKVLNPVSKINVTWADDVRENNVIDGSEISLQKTKSRTFNVNYSLTSVYLGNLANKYEFALSENVLHALINDASNQITSNAFEVTASGDTPINVKVLFVGNDDYINALNNEFKREFIVNPIDGVIEFNLTEQNLPITPSTNATVRVRIRTTASTDAVIPHIKTEGGKELSIKTNADKNQIEYFLPTNQTVAMLFVKVTPAGEPQTNSGVTTLIFDVNFSVNPEFKVVEDMTFKVYFVSETNTSSEHENGGVFELAVSRQNFTGIDISNTKIQGSTYGTVDGRSVTLHTQGMKTSTLAPGTSSILRVNVNPESAYFDYMQLSYSGALVADAITLERLTQTTDGRFYRTDVGTETIGSVIRYNPSVTDRSIYFRVWVNTTVNVDTIIKFTATFFASDGTILTYANYYISVSYLKEPTITVDGEKTAFIAKGSSAELKITVLEDQRLDTIEIVGTNIKGIERSSLIEEVDHEKGIKTYTATLYATIFAQAENNEIYIQGKVVRELNGSLETKTAIATVKIVDFKIDTNNITVEEASGNSYEAWLGVPQAFTVNYNLIPENYVYDQSDEASVSQVQNLLSKRREFLNSQTYANQESNFYINYDKEEGGQLQPKSLYQRLFYVNGNESTSVSDKSGNWPVEFVADEQGKVTVVGKTLGASVQVKLETYVYADSVKIVYSKEFTITVAAYSDEDIPLTISNTDEFYSYLKPNENQTDTNRSDFILTSDILLENYEPFATNNIKSLDGNGYTIFVKSFNVEPADTSVLNIGLFTTVQSYTTLKNVRVNLYNGGQLTIDKSVYKEINIAGFAVRNEGIIYNSEVVSYFTESLVPLNDTLHGFACERHSNPEGINVKYINGKNTSDPVYITDGSDWTTRAAGFVLENSGAITNSRVGGDQITIINGQRTMQTALIEKQTLSKFNINSQGNMAGFVLENSGAIASSFAKNIDMTNTSNSTSFYLAGFVGQNTSSIITSYVEGVQLETHKIYVDDDTYNEFKREGSSLKSNLGFIAGFIYNNSGDIKDSYSNIIISNNNNEKVYLASGFVYTNAGSLYNCFSASQVKNAIYTQMNFSGLDEAGNLLSNGNYTNCYFMDVNRANSIDEYDASTESQFNTGAVYISDPKALSSFYGFSLTNTASENSIWRYNLENGISLVEPNTIAISHRYVNYIDDEPAQVTSYYGQDKGGKYVLPYGELRNDQNEKTNTMLGGNVNPIIIADAKGFANAMGASTSSNYTKHFNEDEITGNYRLVGDVNLADLISADEVISLPSTTKAFKGALRGNGFTISGVSITSLNNALGYGLFASLENAYVSNFNLQVIQVGGGAVSMVGAIAGYAKDSTVINVDIEFGDGNGVTALNFAGALFGASFGNTYIENITVQNPRVIANQIPNGSDSDKVFNLSKLVSLRGASLTRGILSNYSYAGGLIGFVDNYANNNDTKFVYNKNTNASVHNVRVNGQVFVRGAVAGGIFGLVGYSTYVNDVGITIEGNSTLNNSKIIATEFYAGGVAGQAYGSFERIFAKHTDEVQQTIEDDIATFYNGDENAERGALDIFFTRDGEYSQKYVGGLIGYAESGALRVSYSKLNVTSPTANYAGGIIGGINVSKNDTYNFEYTADKQTFKLSTQYIVFEVYATGDIRAKVFAGGIFGAILKDENVKSRIHLFNVNAFNYISNYDYENEEYVEIGAAQTNLSPNFKLNIIVGHMLNGDNVVNPTVFANRDGYLDFFRFKQVSVAKASFGFYQSYVFEGTEEYVNLFGEITNKIIGNKLFEEDKFIFAITGPAVYSAAQTESGSEIGHIYTQNAFLNNDIWSVTNWKHDLNQLFPDIRYISKPDILYLDCFNVSEVFTQMGTANSFVKVIVRGLVDANGSAFSDIDVGDHKITNFSGSIIGLSNYTNEKGEQVRIKSAGSFINQASAGFTAKNLIVEYTGKEGDSGNKYGLMEKGLFINGDAQGITIKNLRMIVNTPYHVQNTTQVTDVGLVASKLVNSSISGLSIEYSGGSDALMQFDSGSDLSTKINAGLIAGSISQTNSVEIKKIENITIKLGDNTNNTKQAISFSWKDATEYRATEYNVGTYFGYAERKNDEGGLPAQELRIGLGDLDSMFMFTNLPNTPTMNIGGYIGLVSEVNSIQMQPQENGAVNVVHDTIISGSNAIDTVNHGVFIGTFGSTSSFSLNGQSSTPKGGLYSSAPITNLNAGGIIGINGYKKDNEDNSSESISIGSDVTISGFGSINYEVAGLGTNNAIVDNTLSTNSFENYDSNDNAIKLSVTKANVGVVIGKTKFGFTFDGGSNSDCRLNSDLSDAQNPVSKNSFRLAVTTEANTVTTEANTVTTEANIGSVLGLGEANKLEIKGKVTSNLQTLVVSESKAINFGGMVGKISADTPSVKIGGNGNKLTFNGGVYSNVKTINFGGAVGSFYESSTASGAVYESSTNSEKVAIVAIQDINFSGALKVFGSNSNEGSVYAGGVLGFGDASSDSAKSAITIANNNLWGDVFVEYGDGENDLKSLKEIKENNVVVRKEYYFGGIIGNIKSYKSLIVKSNNSAMTSHNARYEDKTATAHALFGTGVTTENSAISDNYYSHSVVLLTDALGTDVGYYNGYTTKDQGYGTRATNETITCATNETIISKIKGNAIQEALGNKLNPAVLDDSGATQFNGITYYQFSIAKNSTINNNIAVIGDGIEKTYEYETYDSSVLAPISALKGFSFASSIVLNVDINVDSTASDPQNFAGLVGAMEGNSILYASQVKGNIEVGGSGAHKVSGLVGDISAGKISTCSTDVDIIYRAGKEGSAYGLAQITGSGSITNAIIENSYSAGSIKTYIDANIHAFIQATQNSHVNNCFTITRLFWNDFTVENPSHNSTIITAFGVYQGDKPTWCSNCYYASNALGKLYKSVDYIKFLGDGKTGYDDLNNINEENYSPWNTELNLNFNYGYPTPKIGYLKVSSYATRGRDISSQVDGYDSYVHEYEYTRLNNNESAKNDNYLMLINIDMISQVKLASGANGWNYILPYDIKTTTMFGDWGIKTTETDGTEITSYDKVFKGQFDGCGNTISGLKNRMFGDIQGTNDEKADVRNVRITEFNIAKSGILANTIANATISNLVVKGNITISPSDSDNENIGAIAIGAIANTLSASKIDTTTNMTQLRVTAKGDAYIGGFAGKATGNTEFSYCSNYGNINVDTSIDGKKIYAGGLVANTDTGSAADVTIKNSYNAASIIVGYTKAKYGDYYAGGLVGHGKAELQNSYNSGMIKAGNKSNGNTTISSDSTTKTDGKAYAGGIIAYGTVAGVRIENCFNEGTIEALGKNPDIQFKWNTTTDTTDTLVLEQTSQRNVWAYGIGYIDGYIDSSGTKSINSVSNKNENIINNGSYRGRGFKLYSKTWDNLFNAYYNPSVYESQSITSTNKAYYHSVWALGAPFRITTWESKLEYKVSFEHDTSDKPCIIKSKDSLGIPNSFSIKIKSNITYHADFKNNDPGNSYPYFQTGTITNDEYLDETFDTSKYFSEKDQITNFNEWKTSGLYSYGNASQTIKTETRSKEIDVNSSKTTRIGSSLYYLVTSNNVKQVFNAGVYTEDVKVNVLDEKIPFVNSRRAYTVSDIVYTADQQQTSSDDGEESEDVASNILADVIKVNYEEKSLTIRFISNSPLKGNLSYKLSCNYDEPSKIIDLSNHKYVYIDDYSYGIDWDDLYLDKYTYKNTKIMYKDDEGYDTVIKASKEQIQDTDHEPDEGDSKYIYFGYDKDKHLLVYIPNATLQRGADNPIIVNETSDFDGDESFVKKVEKSIESLGNNNYLWIRYKTEEKSNEYVTDLTTSTSQTFTPDVFSKDLGSGNKISYGGKITPTITEGLPTDKFTYVGEVVYSFDVKDDYSECDFIIKDEDATIAHYNNGTWSVMSGTFSIKDKTNNDYTLSFSVNELGSLSITTIGFDQFNFDGKSDFKEKLLSKINGFMIYNTNHSIEDYVDVNESSDSLEITSAEHYVGFIINPGQVTIGKSGDDEKLAYDGAKWIVADGYSIKVDGYTFVVSSEGQTIQLTCTETSAPEKLAANQINSLKNTITISGLQYIVNSDSQTVSASSPIEYKNGTLTEGGITVAYSYVNEDWIDRANEGKLKYTVDDSGKLTIEVKEDQRTEYTLTSGDTTVSVYYGSIEYSASHTYDVKFERIMFNETYYGSYFMADENWCDFVTSSDRTLGDNGAGITKSKDSASLQIDVISSYSLGEVDFGSDYEFELLLNKGDDYVLVSGELAPYSDASQQVKNVVTQHLNSQYYVREGDEQEGYVYSIAYSYDENQTYYIIKKLPEPRYDEVTDLNEETFNLFKAEGNLYEKIGDDVYSPIDKNDSYNSETTYYVKVESDGFVEAGVSEDFKKSFNVEYAGNNIAVLTKEYKPAIVKYFILDSETGEYEAVTEYIENATYYTKGENGYSKVTGIDENSDFGVYKYSKNDIYASIYRKNIYKYKQQGIPTFRLSTWEPSSETVGYQYSINDYTQGKNYYTNGQEFNIVLKKGNDTSAEVKIDRVTNYTDMKIFEISLQQTADSSLTPHDIVLMDDISFNEKTDFNKKENINIIGNGYFISYFDGPLYKSIDAGTASYFRDITLLCDMKDADDEDSSSALAHTVKGGKTYNILTYLTHDGDLNLNNISIYGALNNFMNKTSNSILITKKLDREKKGLITGNIYTANAIITIKTLNLYLNVDGINATNDINILHPNTSGEDCSNYGVIVAKDGENASRAVDGTEIVYATNGGSINVKGLTNNLGILKLGDGGNAFGGKDSVNYSSSNSNYMTGTSAIGIANTSSNPGKAGSLRTDENVSISSLAGHNGFTALSGATGRLPFATLSKAGDGRKHFYVSWLAWENFWTRYDNEIFSSNYYTTEDGKIKSNSETIKASFNSNGAPEFDGDPIKNMMNNGFQKESTAPQGTIDLFVENTQGG